MCEALSQPAYHPNREPPPTVAHPSLDLQWLRPAGRQQGLRASRGKGKADGLEGEQIGAGGRSQGKDKRTSVIHFVYFPTEEMS